MNAAAALDGPSPALISGLSVLTEAELPLQDGKDGWTELSRVRTTVVAPRSRPTPSVSVTVPVDKEKCWH